MSSSCLHGNSDSHLKTSSTIGAVGRTVHSEGMFSAQHSAPHSRNQIRPESMISAPLRRGLSIWSHAMMRHSASPASALNCSPTAKNRDDGLIWARSANRMCMSVLRPHAGERVFRICAAGGGHHRLRDGDASAAFHDELRVDDAGHVVKVDEHAARGRNCRRR